MKNESSERVDGAQVDGGQVDGARIDGAQIGFDGDLHPLTNLVLVELELIDPNPYQPRAEIALESVSDLARGIALKRKQLPQTCGLMQVPVARRVGDRVELAFGHRRNLAFEFNNENDGTYDWSRMPLQLVDLSDEEMYDFAARENGDRQDLNDIDKARSIQQGMEEFGWTLTRAANAHGLSKSAGGNLVRLLQLPDKVREWVAAGELGQRHARELLRLAQHEPPLAEACQTHAYSAIQEGWTVEQVQRAVDEHIQAVELDARRETSWCRTCGREREFSGSEIKDAIPVRCEGCGYLGTFGMWSRTPIQCVDCLAEKGPFFEARDLYGYNIYENGHVVRRCRECQLEFLRALIKREHGADGLDCPRCGQAVFPEQDIRPDGSVVCDACKRRFSNLWELQRKAQAAEQAAEQAEQVAEQPAIKGGFARIGGEFVSYHDLRPESESPAESDQSPDRPRFDCPRCGREKIVETNGGAWCLGCDARWDSVDTFRLELVGQVGIDDVDGLDGDAPDNSDADPDDAGDSDAGDSDAGDSDAGDSDGDALLRLQLVDVIMDLLDLVDQVPADHLAELGRGLDGLVETFGVFRENSEGEDGGGQ